MGQTQTEFSAEQDEQRLVVTGSHIKRIDRERASPVVVLDRQFIEGSGATTTLELLQLSAFNSGGTFNEQFTEGFTPGAAAFDLRGFNPDRTLVLLDGRRLPIYPFGAEGSTAFVDINNIPLSSIRRIEILKDGASAVYGSDAIAGVVNIITYDLVDKTTASLYYGDSEKGGGRQARASVLTGWQIEAADGWLSLEYLDRKSIVGAQRAYADSLNGPNGDQRSFYSFPGTFYLFDPISFDFLGAQPQDGCDPRDVAPLIGEDGSNMGEVCKYDYARKQQLIPPTERASLASHFNWRLGDVTLLARYHYSRTETVSNGFFDNQPSSELLPALFADYPFDSFLFFEDEAVNPTGQVVLYDRRLTELPDPTIETISNTHNLFLGAEIEQGEFTWESGASFVKTWVDETYQKGWVTVDAFAELAEAALIGDINIFEPLSSQQQQQLLGSFDHNGESEIATADLTVSGPAWDTDLGPVWVAAGLEYRREEFFDRSDAAIIEGLIIGLGASGAEGERSAWAAYLEFDLPLLEQLEMNLALRYDRYSDFGSTVNPKIGLRWMPFDSLLLRASWGTAFKAPGLHELNSSEIVGTQSGFSFISRGNPDLGAEESTAQNIGLVYQPSESLEMSLDVWEIDAENLVTTLGVGTILTATDDQGNLLFEELIRDDFVIVDEFVNVAGRRARGVDASFRWSWQFSAGELVWDSKLAYLAELEAESYPGSGFEGLDGDYQYPHWRGNSFIKWLSGAFDHNLVINYVGGYDAGSIDEIGSWTVFDYQFAWQVTGADQLALGVKNLLDRDPPQDALFGWPYYNQNLHNPQGRFFYLSYEREF